MRGLRFAGAVGMSLFAAAAAWGQQAAPQGASGTSATMLEHGGKIYAVSGSDLVRLDAKTLKVELRKTLTGIGKTDEDKAEEKKQREEYLKRYDANGDGELTDEELGRRRYLRYRYDANRDGKLTVGELTFLGKRSRAAAGEVTLMIHAGALYMLRAGSVFVFDLATLEVQKTAEVVKKRPPPAPAAAPKPAAQPKPGTKKPEPGGGDVDAF